jgi:hypothetical protein
MLKFIPQNVRFVALGVLASGLAIAPAHAATIGSYIGSTGVGLVNSPLTYNNTASGTNEAISTNGAVAGYYNSAYTAPFSNTAYVSFSADGGNGYGTTYYTTTFTGNYAGGTGTIDYLVDNDLGITLNGHSVLLDADTTTFPAFDGPGVIVSIPSSYFVDGTNTLVFDVFNSGGPTAFDFTGTVSPAATPEPGSLVLLGTGMLGIAGAVRRRFKK